jgi:hypothetical protein
LHFRRHRGRFEQKFEGVEWIRGPNKRREDLGIASAMGLSQWEGASTTKVTMFGPDLVGCTFDVTVVGLSTED